MLSRTNSNWPSAAPEQRDAGRPEHAADQPRSQEAPRRPSGRRPAMTVMNVRTIGTKRPSTIARLPYLSKNSCVRSTFSCLNSFEFGLSKIAGPALRPMQ